MTVKEMIALFRTYNEDDRVVIRVNDKLVDITMITLDSSKFVKAIYQQAIDQDVVVLSPAANGYLEPRRTSHSEVLLDKCKKVEKAIRKST